MNAQQFHAFFGEEAHYWREDPDHPRKEWKREVMNADTLLGYWDWVLERTQEQEET